jgi:hypothetical protein
MKKLLRRRSSAAMIVAILALVVALSGTAYAGFKLGLGTLSKGARNATVGVGPLTYVSVSTNVPPTGPAGATVLATCPPGTVPIGGGIRVLNDATMLVIDSHPVSGGWGGTVFNGGSVTTPAVVSIGCGISRRVSGALATTSKAPGG